MNASDMKLKVEVVPIAKIKPHPENPRAKHKVDRIIGSSDRSRHSDGVSRSWPTPTV